MYADVLSGTLTGLDGTLVHVEADIAFGLPSLSIVGLPDASVREARERVRSAIKNSGFTFPSNRLTVNLAPANTPKEGSHFDLAIAISLLVASGIIHSSSVNNIAILGELSLGGRVNPIKGALPLVLGLIQRGVRYFVLPEGNFQEISIAKDAFFRPVSSLAEAVTFFTEDSSKRHPLWISAEGMEKESEETAYLWDFKDVIGQQNALRALLISAASLHNLLFVGPFGSGKSMMAKRLPSIMPPLTYDEKIELTKIYSVAGLLNPEMPLVSTRPFRSIHHNISLVGLTGGGKKPRPGEISLAHYGILFMDEFPEFSRAAIECLRQPIEEECITISRIRDKVIFPSKFLLIASMNLCPCGNYGSLTKSCTCTEWQRLRYLSKVSGPIRDRLDLVVEVMPLEYNEMVQRENSFTSSQMRTQVNRARSMQLERFQDYDIRYNSQMGPAEIQRFCKLNSEASALMEAGYKKLGLSTRSYFRIIKVARTIADLEESRDIQSAHVAEAIRYKGSVIEQI